MAPICKTELDKWQDRYDDWKEASDRVDDLRDDALLADAAMATTCGIAVIASVTIIGGIIGGGACAVAVGKLTDAILDLKDGVAKANDKAARSDAQGAAYNKCVADHKKDP
jgi:hypothetical protein